VINVHKIVLDAEAGVFLPFALSQVRRIVRRLSQDAGQKYGTQRYEIDGVSIVVYVDMPANQAFVKLSSSTGAFEFFTPKYQNFDWAERTVPPGYITRVTSDGKAVAVGHSDPSLPNPLSASALWHLFGYAHDPQVQAVNQYQFWPDRAGPACCLTTWHRDVPTPDSHAYGFLGAVDSFYDLPPTVSSKSGALLGSVSGSAPDTDWYRRAGYAGGFCYMMSAECKLYVYRVAAGGTVPPNVTDYVVVDLPLPANVRRPIGPFREAPTTPPDPASYPDYRWSWRSDCQKVAAVVNEDIGPYYDITQLVEFSVVTTVNPDNTFSVSVTLDRALRSSDSGGKYYIGAEYGFNNDIRRYVNPEPLLIAYLSHYNTRTGVYQRVKKLFVEDPVGVLFSFVLYASLAAPGVQDRWAEIVAIDLRSLSFVFTTGSYLTNSYAVLVYAFGSLQHSHGFFGYDPAQAVAFHTGSPEAGLTLGVPDPNSPGDIATYSDLLHPDDRGGPYRTTPRTSFQVHPKGHFSICAGPFVVGSVNLDNTPVTVEQHYVDLIGFKQGGRYSHITSVNAAHGLALTEADYYVDVDQFVYEGEYFRCNGALIARVSHPTNPSKVGYKRLGLPVHGAPNDGMYNDGIHNDLDVFGLVGSTVCPEYDGTGIYFRVWPFFLPYPRGDCQFTGA
jgi:hypothetical protein